VIRRLQDLVHGKKHQALHLLFLDWEKAFDKVDTDCLDAVLERFAVPAKVREIVTALVSGPLFQVSMAGDMSDELRQGTGIRQGCTLSPFLFTLILAALMHDAVSRVHQRNPLAVTPTMPVSDLEYADDTVLIARTAAMAEELLREVEAEAAKYGLKLNRAKTCRLAMGSEQRVRYADNREVPRVESVVYLGAIIHESSDPGPELKARMAKGLSICKALRPLWASRGLPVKTVVLVLQQCVLASVLYGLHTLFYHRTSHRRINAFQVRCARRALRIRTTYASKKMEEEPTRNREVAQRAGLVPLTSTIMAARYRLLGHLLRQEGSEPTRAVAYDRFGHPKTLRSTPKAGIQRLKWTKEVMEGAANALEQEGLLQAAEGGKGHRFVRVAALAQNREGWSRWVKKWAKRFDWRDFE